MFDKYRLSNFKILKIYICILKIWEYNFKIHFSFFICDWKTIFDKLQCQQQQSSTFDQLPIRVAQNWDPGHPCVVPCEPRCFLIERRILNVTYVICMYNDNDDHKFTHNNITIKHTFIATKFKSNNVT